jgi:hypothetical protein
MENTMRDLINLIENVLTEAAVGMSANEIKKYQWRFDKFIEYITQRKPFTTVDGKEVLIAPGEAKRFQQLYNNSEFTGALQAKQTDGNLIALSSLAKTKDFGGAAVAFGQDASTGGKEALLVKPSQIGIVDKNIPATDLYNFIKTNPVLNSTEYGKVVIQLADYIVSGEQVIFPEDYQSKDKEKIRKAIVDYAGEYLGVLALLYYRSDFPKREEFNQWLDGTTDDLIINFPSKANTNLADSFATIVNPKTQHALNISSKGTGGGAAPAISGLKLPDSVKNNPRYKVVTQFVQLCQEEGTIPQAFSVMDLLYANNPKSIDKKWHAFLPFATQSPKLQLLAKQSIDNKKNRIDTPLPSKYSRLFGDLDAAETASDGGKLVYSIKKEVADAVNSKDAIPEFKSAILEILEMNFIQQYTDYTRGELLFATQWPAKLSGEISVVNKSSSVDPTAGGFSFKLGRPTAADSGIDTGSSANLGTTAEPDTAKLDAVADTPRLTGPGARAAKTNREPKMDRDTLGREKRN